MLNARPERSECYAEALCRQKGWVPERVFCNQYLITPDTQTAAGIEGWQVSKIGGWTLWHDPNLTVCEVIDASGTKVGLLCGVAVGPTNTVVESELKLSFPADRADARTMFEDLLMDVRGRYVTLVRLAGHAYVYTDPGADMGVVYDATARRLGLSLPLVLERSLTPGSDVTKLSLLRGTTPLRAGMTADSQVRRLLPNHFLCLDTFETQRFWPREAPTLAGSLEEQRAIGCDIAERLGQNISAFVRYGSSAIPISGGKDSPILLSLAASRGTLPDISYTHRTNWISGYDAILGEKIANHLKVPFRFLDAISLCQDERWSKEAGQERTLRFVRSGFSSPKVSKTDAMSTLMVPDVRLVLRGNMMELLGGRFHQSDSVHNLEQTQRLIWGRNPKNNDETALWESVYLSWKNGLPAEMPEKTGLDLAFIELLYSHAMAGVLQSLPKVFYLNPFSDRYLISQTMRIPSVNRRNQSLYSTILERGSAIPKLQTPKRLGKQDSENHGRQLADFLGDKASDLEIYTTQAAPEHDVLTARDV